MKVIVNLCLLSVGILLWCAEPAQSDGASCQVIPPQKGLLCIAGDKNLCQKELKDHVINSCKFPKEATADCTLCRVCGTELRKDCCEIKHQNSSVYFTNNGDKDIIQFTK